MTVSILSTTVCGAMLAVQAALLASDPSPLIVGCAVFTAVVFVMNLALLIARMR